MIFFILRLVFGKCTSKSYKPKRKKMIKILCLKITAYAINQDSLPEVE